jgi:hypothetical protein
LFRAWDEGCVVNELLVNRGNNYLDSYAECIGKSAELKTKGGKRRQGWHIPEILM